MKRVLCTAVLVSFFVGSTVISSLAAAEHRAHHPGGEQTTATTSTQRMMGPQGRGKMPCMADPAAGSMSQMMGKMGKRGNGMGDMMSAGMANMMGAGKMGRMEQRMAHLFFLDRAEELGLSTEQVGKLKALHSECRKDNIRNAAEAKIARLDLADLLDRDNWSLTDAETLVRAVQKLEGDMQLRHLQAVNDVRKVLTVEQLQQARSGGDSGNLESLFQ